MVQIHYCPRCSTLVKDPLAERCHRCGAELRSELQRKIMLDAEAARKSQQIKGPFKAVTGRSCPQCHEPIEILPKETRDFFVKGKKSSVGPSGDEFAFTRARITFQPWRCLIGHMFYSSHQVEWKEVCPRCRQPVNSFAKVVLSCPKCRIMVPLDAYVKGEATQLLQEAGYSSNSSLEASSSGISSNG